ncbi:UNVERIFIED_CONTAM: hypothetical protein RMT77_007222 [Armadillidium vulgare]
MGKSRIVSAVQFEATELVKIIKKEAGKPAPYSKALATAVINVLWQMVSSKRFDFDDENLLEFHFEMNQVLQYFSSLVLMDLFPWINTVSFLKL